MAKGKVAAAKDDAVKTFSGSQSGNLQEIAQEIGNDCKIAQVAKSEDITKSFVETVKFTGPQLLISKFFVYKGLVSSLMGRAVDQNANTLGIIAGKDDAAVEICLGSDLSFMISNTELKERWNNLGYDVYGLVAWDHESDTTKYAEAMATLMSLKDTTFLLMICHASGDPDTWEFNNQTECSGGFVAVDTNSKKKNRRKDIDYKVFNIGAVGVTLEDCAKFQVAKAMQSYLVSEINKQHPKTSGCSTFCKWTSPPDGYCFWHAVLAGLDKSYLQIARQQNGFAVNPRREKHESQAAKNMLNSCVGSKKPDEVFKNGYVELQQIEDVATSLNLAIRVTICDEACAKHTHTHPGVYIYIYI